MDYDDVDIYAEGPDRQHRQAGDAAEDEQKSKPKRVRAAPRRRKPKLTLEDLQKPSGFQFVFQNFPKWFQEGYKGKGHEVRDLRRLLELYQRWQPQVFPHGTYNQFEAALEKMSGTHALKDALGQMRQGLVNIVDPPPPQLDEDQQQQDQQQDIHSPLQQQHPDAPPSPGFGGFGDFDDDELLALQAEDAAMDAAEEAVPELFEDFEPTGAAAAAHTVQTRVASNMNTTKRTMRDWSDDDDDDDDGPVGFSRQQQQGTASVSPSAANRAATLSQAADVDAQQQLLDDLLDDMLQDEDLLLPDAAAPAAAAAAASGAAVDQHQSSSECRDGDDDGDYGSRKAKRSRLQRTAALQDSSEDNDMEDVSLAAADDGEPEQQLPHVRHEAAGIGLPLDSLETAAPNKQQQKRQWHLADDDSDADDNDALAPAAAAAAVDSQQQLGSAGGNSQAAGTQGVGAVGATDVMMFAPLAAVFAPLAAVNTLSVNDVGTAEEIELVLGTDLQDMQQQQQQQ